MEKSKVLYKNSFDIVVFIFTTLFFSYSYPILMLSSLKVTESLKTAKNGLFT